MRTDAPNRVWHGIRQRLAAGPTPAWLAGVTIVLLAADHLYQQAGNSFLPGGLLDETAHLTTALLLLWLLGARARDRWLGPALVASVAIDLDHVPGYLGDQFLTAGTQRPHSHSLLTIVLLLAAAAARGRRRDLWVGLALGVVFHFFRDMAEGSGAGVPLLWPLSDRSFDFPHGVYVAVMVAVACGLVVVLRRERDHARTFVEPGARRLERPFRGADRHAHVHASAADCTLPAHARHDLPARPGRDGGPDAGRCGRGGAPPRPPNESSGSPAPSRSLDVDLGRSAPPA